VNRFGLPEEAFRLLADDPLRFESDEHRVRGGSSDLALVRDRLLCRTVVRKRPRTNVQVSWNPLMFKLEAQVTAQLDHPAGRAPAAVRLRQRGSVLPHARGRGRPLIRDIYVNGQTAAVFVRPKEEGQYQIISGFRRVGAILEIGGENALVLARVFEECSDDQALRISVAENHQRDNLTKQEYVDLCVRLRDQGWAVADLMVGVCKNSIYNYLSVAHCHPAIQDELHKGGIGIEVARALSQPGNVFPGPYFTLEAVLDRIAEANMTSRQVKELLAWQKVNADNQGALDDRATGEPRRRGKHQPIRLKSKLGERVELTIKWRKSRPQAELVEIAEELERHARYARAFLSRDGITSSNPFLTK
jgi:ParB/RepB/Spo0J family partition protein